MRKCNNCDTVCTDNEKFCKNCGLPTAAVEEPAAPIAAEEPNPAKTKKKKTGLILGICGAIALVGALAAILLLPKLSKKMDAMHRFIDAQEAFFSSTGLSSSEATLDSLMSGEYKSPLQNISTDAELTLDISGIEYADKISKLSLFFNILNKDGEGLSGVDLRYNGASIISAILDKTDNGFGVYIEKLSDKRYELTNELLTKMGTTYSSLGELPTEVSYDRINDLKKSYEEIKKTYSEIFFKGVTNDDFTIEKKTVQLDNLGVEVKSCTEIVFTPSAEKIEAILKDFGERLKNDKALSNHILSVMERYMGKSGMEMVIGLLSSSSEFNLGENGLLPIFEAIADELIENSGEAAKSIAESNFSWRVVTDKKGQTIVQQISTDDGCLIIESNDVDSYFAVEADGEKVVTLHRDLEKNGSALNGTVAFRDYGSDNSLTVDVSDLKPDVKSAFGIPYGKFNIRLSGGSFGPDLSQLKIAFEVGESEKGGTDHRITVDGIRALTADDEAPERIALCLHSTDKDSTGKKAQAETVLIENEDQLRATLDEMSNNFEGIATQLMLMFMF